MTATTPRRGGSQGRVLVGLALVAIGAVWLLASTGALDVDWAIALPVALVAVGLGVLATARSGGSAGLVGLGVLLTILAVLSVLVSPAFSPEVLGGGIGDRRERPGELDDPARFDLAIGALTLDLRGLDDADGRVEAAVGMGDLQVIVPDDVDVELSATVGAGEIDAFGEQRDGAGVRLTETFPADGRSRGTLELDASVTLGQVEVRR